MNNKGRIQIRLPLTEKELKALNKVANMDFSTLCRSEDNVTDIISVMDKVKKYTDSYLYKLTQQDEQ